MSTVSPKLKLLHCPDVLDPNKIDLDGATAFCVLVQAMFGPSDSEGQESFDVLVCNTRWIDQKVTEGVFDGRHHLVVSSFDLSEIGRFLREKAKECEGASWDEVAAKLSRIGKWEFEDYVA